MDVSVELWSRLTEMTKTKQKQKQRRMRVDLETFFSIGASSTLSAQNTFTNRSEELEAFFNSLEEQKLDDPVGMIEDVRSPRRNVLVFFGMGGIGKTRLSKEFRKSLRCGR